MHAGSRKLPPDAGAEDAIRAIHQQMIDAWNTSSGMAFATPFTDDVDFVAFEGTHLKGCQEIASFHQTNRDGDWRAEALLNARGLTLERQFFWDDVDALPIEAQRQVTDLLASLKQRHQLQNGRAS